MVAKNGLIPTLALLVFIFCQGTAASEVSLRMGWESWGSYQFREEGRVSGLDIELVRAVVENAGYSLELEELPWKRHLKLLKAGRVDLAPGATKTEERMEYAYFTEPYRQERVVLFVRAEDKDSLQLEELGDIVDLDFTLGVAIGYYYGDEFEDLMEDPVFQGRVERVVSDQDNFKKLARGRIDGFLADPVATEARLRDRGYSDRISAYPLTVYSGDIHIMVSKAACSRRMVTALDESLREIRGTDLHGEILERYRSRAREEGEVSAPGIGADNPQAPEKRPGERE